MGFRIGVIAACEVSVVASNNRVLLSLFDVFSVPLTNAWATRISQDHTPYVLERCVLQSGNVTQSITNTSAGAYYAISLHCGPNLLRAWSYSKTAPEGILASLTIHAYCTPLTWP